MTSLILCPLVEGATFGAPKKASTKTRSKSFTPGMLPMFKQKSPPFLSGWQNKSNHRNEH